MLIEQIISAWNVLGIPPLPVAGLVTGDQQNRLPPRIEREQHPQLRTPRGTRTQLLHVPVPGPADRVHHRATQVRTTLLQQLDRRDYLRLRIIVQ